MNAERGVILIVDDMPMNLNVLMGFLENTGYKVLVAVDGESAIEQAEYAQPDIILLDVRMPGIDGFETCRRLKASELTGNIPVIFMTALSDVTDKVHGFEVGAVDYITKPLQQEEVVARVNTHLTVHRQKEQIRRLMDQDRIQYENLSYMKDQLLSTASHELKNPLASIMLSIDILRRTLPHEDLKALERLNLIQDSAHYMRDLISNLLDIARLETQAQLQKVDVSIRKLIEKGMSHQSTFASENGIALVGKMPDYDTVINCEPFQIDQVIQNLLSNAIKYTPSGRKVEVKTETDEHNVYIEVQDEGIGIPEPDLPFIFDKFYRVRSAEHRSIGGTGLGLSIVREIISQHEGEISVDSNPGGGTTFRFSLPLRHDAPIHAPTPTTSHSSASASAYR
jgi:two-component system sensor histidine kinase/response regulator